jgi:HSP20 family molecular chaperone IbpA
MTAFTDFEELLHERRWLRERSPRFKAFATTNQKELLTDREPDPATPDVQETLFQGYIQPDPPLTPFDPFNPRNPAERRPMPKRPFSDTGNEFHEPGNPLTDVFEDDQAVTIYLELPGNTKDDITLNVAQGKVEVKAKTVYKTIRTPHTIDIERASSRYRNGVLTIILPKKASATNPWNITPP